MNEPTEELTAQALAYLKNEMTPEERARFEKRMTESVEVRIEVERADDFLHSLAAASDASIVRRVNDLIEGTIRLGASDLHLFPERNGMTVRVRLDGVLQELPPLPHALRQAVVDRWKTMAAMNLSERRLPQDGRIALRLDGKEFDLRVNVLPTLYGERVTARILNRSEVRVGVGKLGYNRVQEATLKRLARSRAGLVLVGGWADTGKTTLLYSLLQEAQSPDLPVRNILTVEDPVELQLPSVSQVGIQPKSGLTFAAALRGILRSDPDVVLCGEIRDAETASLCVQLATTGHLVFAALSVPNALAIVERLRGFGLPDFQIADAVTALIGLQLVRQVDAEATEEYMPSPEDLETATLTSGDGPFRRGVPHEPNGNTGYRGRTPLIEIIEMNDRLRRRLTAGATTNELCTDAFPNGIGSLRHAARERIKAGLTTVEEVNRALGQYTRD